MAVFLINVFLWSTIGYCSDVSMLVARLNGLSAPPDVSHHGSRMLTVFVTVLYQ